MPSPKHYFHFSTALQRILGNAYNVIINSYIHITVILSETIGYLKQSQYPHDPLKAIK